MLIAVFLMKKSLWLSLVVLLSSSLVCVLSLRLYCDSDRSGKYMIDVCSYAAKQRLVGFIKQFRKRWHLSAAAPGTD